MYFNELWCCVLFAHVITFSRCEQYKYVNERLAFQTFVTWCRIRRLMGTPCLSLRTVW